MKITKLLISAVILFGCSTAFGQACGYANTNGSPQLTSCGNTGSGLTGEGAYTYTHVNACKTDMVAGTDYILDNNIGADNTAWCLNQPGNSHLNLNGFTVTGRILQDGVATGGMAVGDASVFNGVINCNFAAGAGAGGGCLGLLPGGFNWGANRIRIHHLTVRNLAINLQSIWGVLLQDASLSATSAYLYQFYNNDVFATTCIADGNTICTRTDAVKAIGRGTGSGFMEAFNNKLGCAADVRTCNCVEDFAGGASWIHNNYCQMLPNSANLGANFETGRGFSCDGNMNASGAASGRADHCVIEYNFVEANGNRAFRLRNSHDSVVQYNYIKNIINDNAPSAAIHVMDEDCVQWNNWQPMATATNCGGTGFLGTYPADYGNTLVQFNKMEMNGGVGFQAFAGTGITFADNAIIQAGANPITGTLAVIGSYSGWNPAVSTTVNILRNGTSLVPQFNAAGTDASVNGHVCKSGTPQCQSNAGGFGACPAGKATPTVDTSC